MNRDYINEIVLNDLNQVVGGKKISSDTISTVGVIASVVIASVVIAISSTYCLMYLKPKWFSKKVECYARIPCNNELSVDVHQLVRSEDVHQSVHYPRVAKIGRQTDGKILVQEYENNEPKGEIQRVDQYKSPANCRIDTFSLEHSPTIDQVKISDRFEYTPGALARFLPGGYELVYKALSNKGYSNMIDPDSSFPPLPPTEI